MKNIKIKNLPETTIQQCEICWKAYENEEITYENVLRADLEVSFDDKKIYSCGYGCYDWLKIASQEEIEAYL